MKSSEPPRELYCLQIHLSPCTKPTPTLPNAERRSNKNGGEGSMTRTEVWARTLAIPTAMHQRVYDDELADLTQRLAS